MPANYQELLQAAFNRFDPAGLMNISGIPQHEYRGELKSFLQQKERATDEVKTADLLYDIFDKAFNTGTDMKGNKMASKINAAFTRRICGVWEGSVLDPDHGLKLRPNPIKGNSAWSFHANR